jgi:hypothetical protein
VTVSDHLGSTWKEAVEMYQDTIPPFSRTDLEILDIPQNNLYPSRDSNQGLPEYEAGVLAAVPRHSRKDVTGSTRIFRLLPFSSKESIIVDDDRELLIYPLLRANFKVLINT